MCIRDSVGAGYQERVARGTEGDGPKEHHGPEPAHSTGCQGHAAVPYLRKNVRPPHAPKHPSKYGERPDREPDAGRDEGVGVLEHGDFRVGVLKSSVRGFGHNESGVAAVSYTHLRAHETVLDLVCRL